MAKYFVRDQGGGRVLKNLLEVGSALSELAGLAATARSNIGAAAAVALRGYIDGFVLSNNAGTPNTKIDIAAGTCRDDANASATLTTGSMTVDCGATGANALDAGALANNTWYHVFVIWQSNGTTAGLASTSVSAPTMPASYTNKRRVGSFKTNGSAQILAFKQDGDLFRWGSPVLDVNANNPGTAAVTRTLSVPTGVRVRADVVAIGQDSAGNAPGGIYLSDLSVVDNAASGVNVSVYVFVAAGGALYALGSPMQVMTNTSAQIRSRIQISNAAVTLVVSTIGWADTRGKDA